MEKEKSKKLRKITGGIGAGIILAATLVGAGFGYAKNVDEISGVDPKYNDVIRIQADVELEKGATLEGAANSIQQTLEFLGRQDSYIRTVGDDRLIIDVPVDVYNDSDNEDTNLVMMEDSANNSSFKKEAENLIVALLFNGTLDFRSTLGAPAFIIDEDTTWVFNESGMDESITTTPEASSSRTIDWETDAKDFYDEAKLTHYNGLPVIQIKLSDKGNDSTEYINAFKDFNNWILANQANSGTYVAWFNYELVSDILDELGLISDGSTAYDYVVANNSLRPLYLTASTEALMTSKYEDTIEIKGNFTEKEAKYFVNKLNSSIYYSYSNIETTLIINAKSKLALMVIGILFIVFIIVIIFAMVAYFGLLGLISASVFTLINLAFAGIFVSSGMLITGLGIISLVMVAAVSSLIIYLITNTYKTNNKDKYVSTSSIAWKKFTKLNSLLLLPIVTAVIIFYLSGLVLTTIIAIPLYLIVIGIVLSYIFGMFVLFPIIYVFDLVTNFTKEDTTGKYDLLTGANWSFENKMNNEASGIKAKALAGILVSVFMLLTSCVIGTTLYFTTGSTINSNFYNNESYIYKVVPTNGVEVYLEENGSVDKVGTEYLPEVYEITTNVTNDIESAFESAGVKVFDIEVVREDDLSVANSDETTIDGNTSLVSQFGFQIYSKTEITTDIAAELNTNLSAIETEYVDVPSVTSPTNWELAEDYSWNGKESFKAINYTENFMFNQILISLLIIVLVSTLMMIFIGNLGVALSTMITTLLEMILAFTPIVILYIPFNFLAAFPLLLLAVSSVTIKIFIANKAKKDEIQTGRWNRAAKEQVALLPIMGGILLVVELILISVYGWIIILPMALITILSVLSILVMQQFVFTFLSEMFGGYRERAKENRLNDDIKKAKDKDELSEEFIEGVNM